MELKSEKFKTESIPQNFYEKVLERLKEHYKK